MKEPTKIEKSKCCGVERKKDFLSEIIGDDCSKCGKPFAPETPPEKECIKDYEEQMKILKDAPPEKTIEWEEYSFKGENPKKCEMICDHDINWCGDSYACNNCGLRFIPAKWANSKLSQQRVKLRQKIKEMQGEPNGDDDGNYYNQALSDILSIIK